MGPSMMDLPVELHLMIVHEIYWHECKVYEETKVARDEDDYFILHSDLMSWSCTSMYFRNLLAPFVFREVRLRVDGSSGNSIQHLLNGPHRGLVKELNIVGPSPLTFVKLHHDAINGLNGGASYVKGDDGNEESDVFHSQKENKSAICDFALSKVAGEVLSNLHEISNLGCLSIGLPYPFDTSSSDYYDELYQRHYNKEYQETDQPDVYILALRHSWRVLMIQVHTLVAKYNIKLPIHTLELRNFPWHFTYPFESSDFQKSLFHVKRFNLRMGDYGDVDPEGIEEQLESLANLDTLFFDHLHSATTFNLIASDERPIGLIGLSYAPLSLNPSSMPKLKHLRLEQIFICVDIVRFLKSHSETFEELVLQNCYSSVDDEDLEGEAFYWKDLFNGLQDANLKRLTRLDILPFYPPLNDLEVDENQIGELLESLAMPQRRGEVLGIVNNRRTFAYAFMEFDTSVGALQIDEAANLASFQNGEDQVAYDRLQKMIAKNALRR